VKRKLLRYLVIVSVCLIITGLVIARLSRRDDPSFNGRRLSASVYDLLEPNSPTYYVSSNAVAHLGLQAIPFLKRTVSKGQTQFEKMALRFNLPIPAHRMMNGRQLAVCRAARILGTNAEPLCTELTALIRSPIGSIRHEALEALFLASTNSLLWLATNTMVRDPFIDCRIAAMRYAFAFRADPNEVVSLAVGNIGKGIVNFPGDRGRFFAETLKEGASPRVLEQAFSKLSHSSDPGVRRFLANWGSVCLPSNPAFIEILERLAKDTNLVVARAATNALTDIQRPK